MPRAWPPPLKLWVDPELLLPSLTLASSHSSSPVIGRGARQGRPPSSRGQWPRWAGVPRGRRQGLPPQGWGSLGCTGLHPAERWASRPHAPGLPCAPRLQETASCPHMRCETWTQVLELLRAPHPSPLVVVKTEMTVPRPREAFLRLSVFPCCPRSCSHPSALTFAIWKSYANSCKGS